MKRIFKKCLLTLAFLAQGNLTHAGSQEIVQEVKNAIKTDAYYWVEAAGIVAIGIGGVIGSVAFHENGWKYMNTNKKVTSGTLLLAGTGLFCAHHNPVAAALYLIAGLASSYYGTKPVAPAIEFEI